LYFLTNSIPRQLWGRISNMYVFVQISLRSRLQKAQEYHPTHSSRLKKEMRVLLSGIFSCVACAWIR
ncbi:MAG: hypothetical protein RSD11_11380, partial [Bacteroides sp.]|uniref:hypothetical protein n=1 Tax=Bacteroides sp. TaxID=29523 RepID=UPI002FC68743